MAFYHSITETVEYLRYEYGQVLPGGINQNYIELITIESNCELEWFLSPTIMKLDATTIVSPHTGFVLFWDKQVEK